MKKLTNIEFIEKSKNIHGDRYDYSLVKYVNFFTKVKIICCEHGEFEQRSEAHLRGQGCPKCAKIYKNNNQFIIEAQNIHGNKYDYSLVNYINCETKVKIICPIHGIFEQTPHGHLGGKGCFNCYGTPLKSTNKFIVEAQNIHGNKYDYSLVNYVNNHTKIKIICFIHGIFEQIPNIHLNGANCPKCLKCLNRNKTNEEFIFIAKNKHENKYDYSLVNYINCETKVKIICPIHGIFEQTPENHLISYGCRKCSGYYKSNTDEFIEKAKLIHNNKYDYSLVKYINNKSKIKIICSTHGIFEQKPNQHLCGKGCKKCSGHCKSNTEEFIEKAKLVHDNKFDYSNTEYINSKLKISIFCPIHGCFKQTPNDHLQGSGCPQCKQSKGEIEIIKIFNSNNIKFIYLKTFDGCVNKRKLIFDFYLPNHNICIEYDGKQHFQSILHFGGEKNLISLQKRDEIKNKYCKENNINLIRIRYDENINNKLKSINLI